MALESVIEWQRAKKMILDYVRQHPGCRIPSMIAGTKYTYTEVAGVVEGMVDAGQLDRWYSGTIPAHYIPGTYIPRHLRDYTPPNLRADTDDTQKHGKTGDKHIAAYLDAFDEFCDECMERYDAEVIGNLSTEAMISLYRGFIAALPDIEKAGERK